MSKSPLMIDPLQMQCHRLIDATGKAKLPRIARRLGAMKLLELSERALTTFAEYKTNRERL
jgi:ribulose 1,5-bisphosphate synthetase/thiazole synthase